MKNRSSNNITTHTHTRKQNQKKMLKIYQPQSSLVITIWTKMIRLFLLITLLLSIITIVNGLQQSSTTVTSSSLDDDSDQMTDQMKQMRRNEVSKALLLLKKHSIVGSNAKIVLKNNGRHLAIHSRTEGFPVGRNMTWIKN